MHCTHAQDFTIARWLHAKHVRYVCDKETLLTPVSDNALLHRHDIAATIQCCIAFPSVHRCHMQSQTYFGVACICVD